MPTLPTTERAIASLKPTPGKRVDYFDRKVPGLVLRVTEHGAKSWTLRYRHRGRSQRLTLASAAALSLADARVRARDELQAATAGANPAAAKQEGRRAETVGELADLYIARWAKPNKRSWKTDRNLLDHKVLPHWKHRAIVDIKRADVLDLVQAVADAGAPVVANRVAALLSKMFAFALNTLFNEQRKPLLEISPATRIPRRVEQARDRVLSEDELRTLWQAWDALPAPMAAFYRLRLLTAQRGGEVASMRWQDVDLESGWWTVPATSSKNKLSHRVPLNASAVNIVAALLQTADQDAVYVLEANYRAKGMGARGKRQQAEAAALFPVENFRGHDLRRSAASIMASGGIPRLTISKILNHVERGVTKVYDRHSYDPEKAAALTWWDAKLWAMLTDTPAAVLPFAKLAHGA